MVKKELVIRDTRRKQMFQVDDEYLNGYARLCGITATGVYMSLCRHVNRGQECWPSMELIGEELAISKWTVIRALKRLEEWGIIEVKRSKSKDTKRQLVNVYTLTDKAFWKQKPGSTDAPGVEVEPGSKNIQKPGSTDAPEGHTQGEGHTQEYIATPQKDVATEGKKVKEKVDPNEPKLLKDFLEECKASKSPHIHVIGEWADTIKPDFKTRGEWSVFLKRNLRPATDLAKFPKHQVERAYVQILKDSKNGEKFRPTLETIIKYLIK